MKPRVLHLVDSFHQGGTERQAVQLIRLLVGSDRYQVRVACLNREGALLDQVLKLDVGEIPVFPLTGFYNANFARQIFALAKLLRRERIQILQTHDFYTNIIGMAAGTLARVPVRIAAKRETGGLRTSRQEFVERRALARARAVVVNGQSVAEHLRAMGVPASKVHILYNGVETTDNQETGVERVELWQQFALPGEADRPVVTIVANLRHPVKDQETFLRAAARVRAEVPTAVFVLAGEGERMPALKTLAVELGLGDAAVFTGRCTRIPELLSLSDVCVLSSTNEGFPNAILEYLAAGKPVVTTDVGGVREAVIDGESGFVVPVGDDAAMAARIAELLSDPELRLRMGQRGSATVAETFSPAARLRELERLYESLLGEHRRSPVAATDSVEDEANTVTAVTYVNGQGPVR
jgi:glycosyltransferase involved in cell wall biosynthesis